MRRGGVVLVVAIVASLVVCDCAMADGPTKKNGDVRTCKNLTVGSSQPDTMISGKLIDGMIWGPPNFGENPKTDMRYHAWSVVLDGPIRVITGPDIGEPPTAEAIREIEVRLVTRSEGDYSKFRDKHVVVRGKFSTQASPYEFTPVVMHASALGSGPAIHCTY